MSDTLFEIGCVFGLLFNLFLFVTILRVEASKRSAQPWRVFVDPPRLLKQAGNVIASNVDLKGDRVTLGLATACRISLGLGLLAAIGFQLTRL